MTGKKNVSLPCAVGSTSYIDTVKNSYYVDKTLLIRDLIDDHAAVTLFTRPRRFGKTLAVDMLKVFLKKRMRTILYIFGIKRYGIAVSFIENSREHIRLYISRSKM